MISEELLELNHIELIKYKKGDIIFHQEEIPRFYFQIKFGEICMNTLNEEGKEFTQGVFGKGDSFGEPPLFINKSYPSSAIVLEPSEIYQIPKTDFFELLKCYPEYSLKLNTKLSKLLHYKASMATEISLYNPEHRISTLFKLMKSEKSIKPEMIKLTRQQIGNLTALRVETVIRSIKSMEDQGLLQIINRKVYF